MESRLETAKEMTHRVLGEWLKKRKQILEGARRKQRAKILMRRKRTQ